MEYYRKKTLVLGGNARSFIHEIRNIVDNVIVCAPHLLYTDITGIQLCKRIVDLPKITGDVMIVLDRLTTKEWNSWSFLQLFEIRNITLFVVVDNEKDLPSEIIPKFDMRRQDSGILRVKEFLKYAFGKSRPPFNKSVSLDDYIQKYKLNREVAKWMLEKNKLDLSKPPPQW